MSIGPKRALVEEKAAVALADEAGGPRLGGAGGVEFLLHEERQLIKISERDDLHVTALV
jgi:hypothetical protein